MKLSISVAYSIWLHFDTKSKLINIQSQVLHHFFAGMQNVWKDPVSFCKSGQILIFIRIQ